MYWNQPLLTSVILYNLVFLFNTQFFQKKQLWDWEKYFPEGKNLVFWIVEDKLFKNMITIYMSIGLNTNINKNYKFLIKTWTFIVNFNFFVVTYDSFLIVFCFFLLRFLLMFFSLMISSSNLWILNCCWTLIFGNFLFSIIL